MPYLGRAPIKSMRARLPVVNDVNQHTGIYAKMIPDIALGQDTASKCEETS
ncbi:hypothetical protein JCM19239_2216 [Vibrio variabilis]|uniref:Uncharacterized protein n=1 Tax=Vibrio variabilis TaxID=990271 RepID=A0ABQ0JHY1_9VIBR|nr:hypothetical protein JCM19239_2216 [Vibrio variabilis]